MRTFGVRHDHLTYVVRPAAYAVILDEQIRVACVAERLGLFLPGGGIEGGEDPERAVHREVAEECARTLEIATRLESAIQFFCTANGEAYELHASFFLARFGDTIAGVPEHELTWHPVSPRPPVFYHECHGWAVRQARDRTAR